MCKSIERIGEFDYCKKYDMTCCCDGDEKKCDMRDGESDEYNKEFADREDTLRHPDRRAI